MSVVSVHDFASGKGHRDENFPVASRLVSARHRAPIMAFYRFARAADDVADHPHAAPEAKLARLGAMRSTLSGGADANPEAAALRAVCAARGLTVVHGLDLLTAFERDCTVRRYADWDGLIDYCRFSAMPVGRFVLDVHGEARETWAASDALCAALQVINHTQDCAKDFRALDRVYLPLDILAAHGARIEDLGRPAATPALRAAIVEMAERSLALLDQSSGFAKMIRDRRLATEVAVIHGLARDLAKRLLARDPLSERVHHGKLQALLLAAAAAARHTLALRG